MRLVNWMKRRSFLVFIALVLLISLSITIWGLIMYRTSGAYKYDLSRPGYEGAREEVNINNESDKSAPYSANGPIDDEALQDFYEHYNKIIDRLDEMNYYDEEVLSDQNLNFSSKSYEFKDVEGEILEPML